MRDERSAAAAKACAKANAREISIPLARVAKSELGSKEDYFSVVHDQYTTQYLKRLGVEPTEQNKKLVARHAPLKSCEIEATWGPLGTLGSAVPNELRIVQPPIEGRQPSGAHGKASALGPREAEVDRQVGAVANMGSSTSNITAETLREEALAAMREADIASSQRADLKLIEELERVRRLARGEATVMQGDPELMRWGEEGDRELEALKRKFILPFASERRRGGDAQPVVMAWQAPELNNQPQVNVPRDMLAEISRPVSVTVEQIGEEVASYVGKQFPLELLTTRRDPWQFAALREWLVSTDAVKLIGLVAHLVYWTCFPHLHRPQERLPEPTRQSLVVSVQQLWFKLLDEHGRAGSGGKPPGSLSPPKGEIPASGMSFVRAVLLLFLKRGAERVFHLQYQKTFSDAAYGSDVGMQLVDQLNVLGMRILDPDCQAASFSILNASMQAIRLWRKLNVAQARLGMTPASRMLAEGFRTTPMVALLVNANGAGPQSPKTRKMMQKSSSDTVLVATTGGSTGQSILASGLDSAPRLEWRRRTALYKLASGRLKSSGFEVVSNSPSRAARHHHPTRIGTCVSGVSD